MSQNNSLPKKVAPRPGKQPIRSWLVSTTALSKWTGITVPQIDYFIKNKGLPAELGKVGSKVGYLVDPYDFIEFLKTRDAGKYQWKTRNIPVRLCICRTDWQLRGRLNPDNVDRLATTLALGKKMVAIDVMECSAGYPVVVGNHRVAGALRNGEETIRAFVYPPGGERFAAWIVIRGNSQMAAAITRPGEYLLNAFKLDPVLEKGALDGELSLERIRALVGLTNRTTVLRTLKKLREERAAIAMKAQVVITTVTTTRKRGKGRIAEAIDAYQSLKLKDGSLVRTRAMNQVRLAVVETMCQLLQTTPEGLDKAMESLDASAGYGPPATEATGTPAPAHFGQEDLDGAQKRTIR